MKKIISILGSVGVFALTTISCTFAYTQEQSEAYKWAYQYGITTQPTIEAANLDGNLTRQAFSKMIINYLENAIGVQSNYSNLCTFTDEDKFTSELKSYAQKTCSLNIMGTNNKAFNPTQSVDRAQLGTVISRILWGDEYNSNEKQYYIYHLNALKYNGIMNKIDNPNISAKRGDVLIMLKRVYEKFGNSVNINGNQTSAYDYKYYDSYLNNQALSNAMKDLKLRSTYCPNIFCQQVGDDGTYNNQKHYYWNEDDGTMTLIPGVYYIDDCSYYDKIYGNNNYVIDDDDDYFVLSSSEYLDSNVIYTGEDGTKYYYDSDFLNILKDTAKKAGESDLVKYLEIEAEYFKDGIDQIENLDLDNLPELIGIDEDMDPETMTTKEKEELLKKIKEGLKKIIKENKNRNDSYINSLEKVTKKISNDKFGLKDKFKETKTFVDTTNSFLDLFSEMILNLMELSLTSEDGEIDDGEALGAAFGLMGSAFAYQSVAEEYQKYVEEWSKETIKSLGSDNSNDSNKSSNTSNKSSKDDGKSSETSNKSAINSDNSWIDDVTKNWKGDIIKAEDLVSKKENKHSAYVKLEKRSLFIDEEYNYILKIGPEFIGYTMEVYYNDVNEVSEIYMRSNSDDIWFQVRVNPRENCKYINVKYGNEYIWGANDERVFTRYSRYKNDWVELITNVKSGKSVDELDKQHNCKAQGF